MGLKIQKILMAYDFSPTSEEALEVAIQLAARLGATLDLIHVVALNEVSQLAELVPHLDRVEDAIQARVDSEFKKVVGKYPNQTIATHIRVGSTAAEISKFAQSEKYQLVVIGTHGRTGLKRFLLGSIAERIVRDTQVPTWVHRAGTPTAVPRIKRILVPIDLSECSLRALRTAKEWASLWGAELKILHVLGERYYIPLYVQADLPNYDVLVADYEQKEQQEIKKTVTAQVGSAAELTFVNDLDPAHAIVETATSAQTDVIMIGTHGRGGLNHVVLGSVAEKVIRYAPCSVLTIH